MSELRPAWIAHLCSHWGEPAAIAGEAEPVRLGKGYHSTWVWFPGSRNHNVRITRHGTNVTVSLSGPDGYLELGGVGVPSDERCMAALAAVGWPTETSPGGGASDCESCTGSQTCQKCGE